MTLLYVTVVGNLGPAAAGAKGYWVPTGWLTAASDMRVIPPAPAPPFTIGADGSFTSGPLLAQDSPGVQPQGEAWQLSINGIDEVAPFTQTYQILHANGDTQDLADLGVVVPDQQFTTYLLSANNLSDVPDPAAGLANLGGASSASLAGEVTRAVAAEAALATAISAEATRAEGAESALGTAIAAETTRAEGAEATLAGGIAANAAAITAETTRAETAEALLAPKASPAFTGTPAAPTASPGAASTQLATTAYADAAVAVETSRAETAEALKAPLASPALTGSPTAPTQTTGDSSTKIATDAFVGTAVGAETTRAEAAEALAALKSANLSDLANAGTARTNLGLGTAATQPASAFDTAGAAAAAQAASTGLRTPTAVLTGTSCTVAAGQFAKIDSTAGAYTATLVAAPADKTVAGVKLVKSAATVSPVTVTCGGSDTFNDGGGTTLALKLLNQGCLLQYNAGAACWDVHADDLPLGGVTAKPSATEVTYFVSAASYASDSNDGLTVYTAKATIGGALTALASAAGTIQLGAGTFTISATDGHGPGSGNGATLTATGTVLRGMGAGLTKIIISASADYGIVAQASLCEIEGFTLQAATGATVTYGVGVTSSTSAESCQFTDVRVSSGAGTVTNGFGVSPDAHQDVAYTTFINCAAFEVASAGWIIGDGTQANVLDTRMLGCVSQGSAFGVLARGTGFVWVSGDMGENTTADVSVANPVGSPVTVQGMRSENSAALLTSSGSATLSAVVSLRDVTWQNFFTPVSTGVILNYQHSGNLNLDNVQVNTTGSGVVPCFIIGGTGTNVNASGLSANAALNQLFSATPANAIGLVVTSYSVVGSGSNETSGVAGPVNFVSSGSFSFNGTVRDVMVPATYSAPGYATTGIGSPVATASRWAGATTGGSPASGTYATGDWTVDTTAPGFWVCTAGGSPGTWSQVGAAPSASVDWVTATGSYTWSKPAGAQAVDVILCAGGSGGGSGAIETAGNAGGGSAGSGAGALARTFLAADLPSSVTGSVGAGGTGGAAVSGTSATPGNPGGSGGVTTFGAFGIATPGGSGAAGTTSGGAPPTFAGGGTGPGSNGGAGGGAAAGTGSNSAVGASGGGGGGGANTSTAFNGAAASYSQMGSSANVAAGGIAGAASPTAGTQPTAKGTPSCGGGGGAGSNSSGGTAQSGAAAFYGGGGGGGGGAFIAAGTCTSGAGGAGGPGFALIITHFA